MGQQRTSLRRVEQIEPWRDALYDALEAVYKPTSIYEQRRYKPQTGEGPREPAQLVRGSVTDAAIDQRAVERLAAIGLIEQTPDRLRVTPQGMLLLDAILSEVVL